MKRKLLSVVFIVLSCVVLYSCNKSDKDMYKIEVDESPEYTVDIDRKAKANEVVSFTVEPKRAEVQIDKVLYEADSFIRDCEKGTESSYQFKMPENDVKIYVFTSILEETTADSVLYWTSDISEIAKYKEGTDFFETKIEYTYNGSICQNSGIELFSSNKRVIPDEALTNEHIFKDNYVCGGHIIIDTKSIQTGETYITMNFTNNETGDEYKIIKKVTVKEYGQIEETVFEEVSVKINIDEVAEEGDTFSYRISDLDYQYGSKNQQIFESEITETGIININVTKGHRYYVEIFKNGNNEERFSIQDDFIEFGDEINSIENSILTVNFESEECIEIRAN